MENSSTILRQAQHRSMAWANGQGSTLEVARHPAEGEFDWRISFARIQEPGPFSELPGIDRWTVLVEGEQVELQVGEPAHGHVLLVGEPFAFAGEEAIHATPHGRTRDLNLMTRRGVCTGTMSVHRLGEPLELAPVEGGELFVAVMSGWVQVGQAVLGPLDVVHVTEALALNGDSNAMVARMAVTPQDAGRGGQHRA